MASHTFKIDGAFYNDRTLPSLNDYLAEIGRHPKAGGRFKDKYMTIVISHIRRDLRGVKITNPVIIDYEFFERNKGRKRDVMNVFSCADKFIEDALVKSGVLKDDSPTYVVNATHEFHYIDSEPYIKVTLREIENG